MQSFITVIIRARDKCGWISHPLAEADDRPQTKAQRAAAAEAATQEPPHVDWQRLPQAAVYAVDTGFEFLRCHLGGEANLHGIVNNRAGLIAI